ncbi:MAG TPA: tetratricopeptide repeat protein [Dehalococcoidia bacterium]|nr:tetratricopeptide repeat protein [Dehalococcoidia bacterium]
MALHTGEADLREGDYYGSAVNRCARIRGAGHGGQVLLSEATAQLVREALPPGASLRELGRHRLRDLSEPERIFQLDATGLPNAFPPLKTLDAHIHNLPLQLTSFIGREGELAALVVLLDQHRLVTLTGPGGTGKTRLALQVAAELLDAFPDGVFFVDLAPLHEPTLVPPAVAQVLGVQSLPEVPARESVVRFLRDKRLLLVLDNYEHLLPAAEFVGALLQAIPTVSVLVTSRAPLRISGEWEDPVAPLPLPDADQASLAALQPNPAVGLFVQRAQALRPAFALSAENAASVAAICTRLDGLPLAIELAATRVRVLPPAALLSRLDQRLPVLTGGVRTLPARQQTLRATIAWSYALLAPAEQVLFRRLGVFVGGFELSAAETVGADEDGRGTDVLEGIATLAEHSLIQARPAVEGEPRFAMLETIREFALEQLVASGEEAAVRGRHARAMLTLAESSEQGMMGRGRTAWLARLGADRDNLWAALRWLRDQGEIEPALNLVGALVFWFQFDARREDLREIEALMALPAAAGHTAARARALLTAGMVALPFDLFQTAAARCAESAAIWRELGDSRRCALAQIRHSTALSRIDPAAARMLAGESVAFLRSGHDQWSLGVALIALAVALQAEGDPEAARPLFEEALAIFNELGDPWAPTRPLYFLALIAFERGDMAEALTLAERSAAASRASGIASRASGMRLFLPNGLELAGRAALQQGDLQRAEEYLAAALRLFWERRMPGGTVSVLHAFGLCAAAHGDLQAAVRLIGAAAVLEEANETSVQPQYKTDTERTLLAARADLGDAAFEQAWQEGRGLSESQAVAEALALAVEPRQGAHSATT